VLLCIHALRESRSVSCHRGDVGLDRWRVLALAKFDFRVCLRFQLNGDMWSNAHRNPIGLLSEIDCQIDNRHRFGMKFAKGLFRAG
jgi:hypothetical protein